MRHNSQTQARTLVKQTFTFRGFLQYEYEYEKTRTTSGGPTR
jgi:hypothetical protein